jgi:hypothetical protein
MKKKKKLKGDKKKKKKEKRSGTRLGELGCELCLKKEYLSMQ